MNKESILKQLLRGDRGNIDKIPLSKEYEYEKNLMHGFYRELEKTLNKEQTELLDKIFLHSCYSSAEYAFDYYTEGFKIGLAIGMECSNKEKEENITE